MRAQELLVLLGLTRAEKDKWEVFEVMASLIHKVRSVDFILDLMGILWGLIGGMGCSLGL